MLKLENCTNFIFKELSFSIGEGEKVALTGPTGSGKSTLILSILGFLPMKGKIFFNNKELIPEELRKKVSVVFSDVSYFNPSLRIRDQYFSKNPLFKKYPFELSGGEIVKVMFEIALSKKPKLLIIDEAFAHLDSNFVKDMMNKILKLDIAVLLISHNVKLIKSFTTRCLIVNGDKIIEDSSLNPISKYGKALFK